MDTVTTPKMTTRPYKRRVALLHLQLNTGNNKNS